MIFLLTLEAIKALNGSQMHNRSSKMILASMCGKERIKQNKKENATLMQTESSAGWRESEVDRLPLHLEVRAKRIWLGFLQNDSIYIAGFFDI